MAYELKWQDHNVYIRYSETVSCSEFMGAILDIHANPNYATLRYVIHDMLGADELDFSDLDMTSLVAQELGARYTNPSVRPAVVSTDPRMAEATRAFSAMTQLNVGFFASLSEALRWATG